MTIPNRFLCPIGQEVMTDPVMTPQGHNFEKANIQDWVNRNGTCPLTREPLTPSDLFPNRALKEGIEEWRSASPDSSASTSPSTNSTVSSSEPQLWDATVQYIQPRSLVPSIPSNAEPWLRFEMTRDEYDNVLALFTSFDEDGSGAVDFSEAKHFCRVLNYPHSDQDITQMFRVCDADGNGSIDFEEFLSYMLDKRPKPELQYGLTQSQYQEILMCFHMHDKDRSGLLSHRELESLCVDMNYPSSPRVIRHMFDDMDADRSGSLTVHEFLVWMKAHRGALAQGMVPVPRQSVVAMEQRMRANASPHSTPTPPEGEKRCRLGSFFARRFAPAR